MTAGCSRAPCGSRTKVEPLARRAALGSARRPHHQGPIPGDTDRLRHLAGPYTSCRPRKSGCTVAISVRVHAQVGGREREARSAPVRPGQARYTASHGDATARTPLWLDPCHQELRGVQVLNLTAALLLAWGGLMTDTALAQTRLHPPEGPAANLGEPQASASGRQPASIDGDSSAICSRRRTGTARWLTSARDRRTDPPQSSCTASLARPRA